MSEKEIIEGTELQDEKKKSDESSDEKKTLEKIETYTGELKDFF